MGDLWATWAARRPKSFARAESCSWQGSAVAPVLKGVRGEHPATAARSEEEAEDLRAEHGILVFRGPPGAPLPKPLASLEEAPFPGWVTAGMREADLSPLMMQVWPAAARGHDLVAVDEAKAGRTAAYASPLLSHLNSQQKLKPGEGPIAIVLVPERDASVRVARQIAHAASATSVVCRALGVDEGTVHPGVQVDVAVATPTALIGQLNSKGTNLCRATFLVVDGADEFVRLGSAKQLFLILGQARPDRQVLLLSEAWLPEVERLAVELCRVQPIFLSVGSMPLSAHRGATHLFKKCARSELKEDLLFTALEDVRAKCSDEDRRALVFCNSTEMVESLGHMLEQRGHSYVTLHGEMNLHDRASVLQRFATTSSGLWLLVSANLFGRWDVSPPVRCIVNFDIPRNGAEYVQRLGRSSLVGDVRVLTFFTSAEGDAAWKLKRVLNSAPRAQAETWRGRGRGRRGHFLVECKGRGPARPRGG